MRLLLKEKKNVKKELAEEKTEEKMERLNQIKEQVLQEEKESYYRRLTKTCEEIRVNGKFNSGGFWKLVKRMKRKNDETPHAVQAKDGRKLTENPRNIKEIWRVLRRTIDNNKQKNRITRTSRRSAKDRRKIQKDHGTRYETRTQEDTNGDGATNSERT